jgi:hypothetical protein
MKKWISSLVKAIVIGGVMGALSTATIQCYREISLRNQAKYILDIDKTRKLSDVEIKRLYDEIGLSPYTQNAFDNLSTKDLETFLRNYEMKPVKKE